MDNIDFDKLVINYDKNIYYAMKNGALKRNINFDVTEDWFRMWYLNVSDACIYCNTNLPDFVKIKDFIIDYSGNDSKILRYKKIFKSTTQKNINRLTIDRIDSTIGYTKSNIVKACWICNAIKGWFWTFDETRKFMPEIINDLKFQIKRIFLEQNI